MNQSAVLILTTVPAVDVGERIARDLVEHRLAACVNILSPMASVYRWKGRIEQDEERQLIVKTTRERVEEVRRRMAALHPYDLPEFLVLEASGGSDAYLAWIAAETG